MRTPQVAVASVPAKMAEVEFSPGQTLPSSKIAVANDVAYMVLYLASDESGFVNGTSMRVDNTMSVTAGVVQA